MTAVAVMAKAPVAGRVKTRLSPLLGPSGCAHLQRLLIRQTCAVVGASGLPLFVFLDDPQWGSGDDRALSDGARVRRQADGHLGQRMLAAVRQVHREQPGPVLVIGTDAPTLTSELLTIAATALRGDLDAVLGPALDGGYYLIGLSRPLPAVLSIDPRLWGGDQVRAATQRQLDTLGARWKLLAPLRDLDTPADAAALRCDAACPPAIRKHLRTQAMPS